MKERSEVPRIVLGTTLLAIVYGIAHDLVTAHVYVPYFTKYHPHILDSESPVVMALLWGVIATWWMGAIIGLVVGLCAQGGASPKIPTSSVLKRLAIGMVAVYVVAMGVLFLCLATIKNVYPLPGFQIHPRFTAVLITHNVSYFLSALVAIGISLFCIVERGKKAATNVP